MKSTRRLDALFDGFAHFEFPYAGVARQVYRIGEGPGVVLMHEVPGLHAGVVRLARQLAWAGFSVWLPVLFGEPGVVVTPASVVGCMGKVCVSREFHVLAKRKVSPITEWLRALARHAHEVCGGEGVGVIGMCLTGGFGLAMMADASVIAPVLANPSLPFALSAAQGAALGMDEPTLARVKERARQGGIEILGLRFTGDPAVPDSRFERLRAEFGSQFHAYEIDSSPHNPHGIGRWAHSVLGVSYVDEEHHPTKLAEQRVIAFLKHQLSSPREDHSYGNH
ncbi:dienelactone hydrolase family protein [Pseudomonas orientalis]|uniref:dienelactone hydrolase family protein n=1 Tax=Pseudomonas orientalis TaxID=76758 RepID=UPI003208899A